MAYVVHASLQTKTACAYFNNSMERAAGPHLWPAGPIADSDGQVVRINTWHVPGTENED